jgi:hypothetical protein
VDGEYRSAVLPGFLLLALGSGLVAVTVTVVAMSGAGQHESGLRSGLTTTAHELGIALVLSVLTAIAAGGLGGGALEPGRVDAVELTAGIGTAFRSASAIAFAAVVIALVGLRRGDVTPGSAHAVMGH